MKLTNRLNLPPPLLEALVGGSNYTPAEGEIRVTELLAPPRQVVLKRQHWNDLEGDASDLIWASLGTAFHTLMERSENRVHVIAEQRLKIQRGGLTISGQFDSFEVLLGDEGGNLTDYKLTTVWKVKDGCPLEWEQQLNTYAYMLRANGHTPTSLQVFAVFRDWSKREARRNREEYPQAQAMMVPVPLWDSAKCEAFLDSRIKLHLAARSGNLPECTPSERWQREPKWAIKKAGNKKAVKLFSSQAEMESHARVQGWMDGTTWVKPYTWEYRAPESVRCLDYCPVAPFCTQWGADPTNPAKAVAALMGPKAA
jgi:hypothetical protein